MLGQPEKTCQRRTVAKIQFFKLHAAHGRADPGVHEKRVVDFDSDRLLQQPPAVLGTRSEGRAVSEIAQWKLFLEINASSGTWARLPFQARSLTLRGRFKLSV